MADITTILIVLYRVKVNFESAAQVAGCKVPLSQTRRLVFAW